MVNGFINLNKEGGMTSQKAVLLLKKILLKNRLDFRKIGHLGTLDPDGEGVLPVALGRATRLFDYFLDKKKTYYTEFLFGKTSDTLDASGKITAEGGYIPDKEEIIKVIPKLTGKILQTPPAYSAKSVDGVRAYKVARRGETPELAPKEVDIYSVELLSEIGQGVYSFKVECGGGTYIRSLARDMAAALGTVGLMRYIRRLESGGFMIEDSLKLSEIENNLDTAVISLEKIVLERFSRYDAPAGTEKYILNGVKLTLPDMPDGFFALYADGGLVGIAERDGAGRVNIRTRLI